MPLIPDYTTYFPTYEQAEQVKQQIQSEDNNWSYTVTETDTNQFVIEIRDESNNYIGRL